MNVNEELKFFGEMGGRGGGGGRERVGGQGGCE